MRPISLTRNQCFPCWTTHHGRGSYLRVSESLSIDGCISQPVRVRALSAAGSEACPVSNTFWWYSSFLLSALALTYERKGTDARTSLDLEKRTVADKERRRDQGNSQLRKPMCSRTLARVRGSMCRHKLLTSPGWGCAFACSHFGAPFSCRLGSVRATKPLYTLGQKQNMEKSSYFASGCVSTTSHQAKLSFKMDEERRNLKRQLYRSKIQRRNPIYECKVCFASLFSWAYLLKKKSWAVGCWPCVQHNTIDPFVW